MAEIHVRDLAENLAFGSRIAGVTWDNIFDQAIRAQIIEIFETRGMIVFEGMDSTSKMQVELSKIFGPLKEHPSQSTPRDKDAADAALGIIDMHYKPRENPEEDCLVERNGRRIACYSPWHFDHCYNDELNRAGVLRAAIVAPEEGRTGFADGIDLYSRFPKHLRDGLENQNIIYTLDTRLGTMRFGVDFKVISEAAQTPALLLEAARFPRAMHPAVWTRKTGEKVLHIGPWMSVGMERREDAEGDAFLDEVCRTLNALCSAEHVYWHEWNTSDMVIWDNWRMLHAVEGYNPKYERRMLRTTIKGDYGLGYFEDGKKIGEVHRQLA
ncbi:TauD/TfdA family dioxygenase [Sphingobium sp. DEHP117]|uniref:TauD/TfdA dioxygenase family protein n=1 Tax=Sphingobium sp. DEHP117 TaxID=2993436 RepID=UPI0027D55D54|nr:TauD/TfdA family dioxygenase [Sphingobium sp. DEHP117]MDQ4420329.1 TauD/TfdA family dioxygenase [Sphingobium sp. DEHP117]